MGKRACEPPLFSSKLPASMCAHHQFIDRIASGREYFPEYGKDDIETLAGPGGAL